MKSLRVTDGRSKAIKTLIGFSDSELERIHSAYKNFSDKYPRFVELTQVLRGNIGVDEAINVVQAIISLRKTADKGGVSADGIMDAVEMGLTRNLWSEGDIALFKTKKRAIANILSLDVIRNTHKFTDLYIGIDPFVTDISILTEIRPVFNHDRTKMECFIIYNKLRVLSDTAVGREKVHEISLERDEIVFLKEECERALKKIESARNQLKNDCRAQIVLYDSDGLGRDEDV